MRKIIACILSAVIVIGILIPFRKSFTVFADNNGQSELISRAVSTEKKPAESLANSFTDLITYEDYLQESKDFPSGSAAINIDASEFIVVNGAIKSNYDGYAAVALLSDSSETEVTFELKNIGKYEIGFEYNSTGGLNRQFELGLEINGETPFLQADSLALPKQWENITDSKNTFESDSKGNELQPSQREVMSWQNKMLSDIEGYYSKPYLFSFKSGRNSLKIKFRRGNLALARITLSPQLEREEYKTVRNILYSDIKVPEGYYQKQEGEFAAIKSDPVLKPTSDRSSSYTSPDNGAQTIKLNTIGQHNWRNIGQSITWTLNVSQKGLYQIGARARQDTIRGSSVSRKIYVNGEVPFREFEGYKFPFSDSWYVDTFGPDKNGYLIYLQEGANTITLEAATSYPEVILSLQGLVTDLSLLYRDIIMITGINPDSYRDYQLEKQIIDFRKKLINLQNKVTSAIKLANENGFDSSSQAIVLNELDRQLNGFIASTDTIPTRLNPYKDNISALGRWIYQLKEQPLEIDYIYIKSPDVQEPDANGSIWDKIAFNVQLFMSSFFNDYNAVAPSDKTGTKPLEVWIAQYGRDQAQILKRLVDNDFIKKNNIPVNVSLVQMGLIPATLTGKGPDIAIFINPQSEIINLAARNALYDLSKFNGYNEVTQRFHKDSMIPYVYMNKTYGIPVTENFPVMYYRKDIFYELGLTPPNTWNEFYKILSVLNRSNLTAGVPSANTSLGGAPSFDDSIFQTFLYQNGGSYYRNGWEQSGFDTPEALSAFKQWTDLFAKYSLPVEYDQFSRFRLGEIPIMLAPYTLFNTLNTAAPELRGLWEIMPIPATVLKDGSLNRSVTAAGTGISMFNKTANKEDGWKFIEWFTSDDIQYQFGSELELYIGPMARFETANKNAFEQLPWSEKDKKTIRYQWDNVKMTMQTPVSYYMARNVSYAFRSVVYKNTNSRETLNLYNKEINKEIIRKRKSLGLTIMEDK